MIKQNRIRQERATFLSTEQAFSLRHSSSFQRTDNIVAEPLVTPAAAFGLPPSESFMHVWRVDQAQAEGLPTMCRCKLRFESRIRRTTVGSKDSLGLNVFVEGATDYFPFPPEG